MRLGMGLPSVDSGRLSAPGSRSSAPGQGMGFGEQFCRSLEPCCDPVALPIVLSDDKIFPPFLDLVS